jgi:hypothetical protein
VRHGDSEDGHEPIAQHLRNGSSEAFDDLLQRVQAWAKGAIDLLWVKRRRKRRVSGQVDEQDADELALTAARDRWLLALLLS